MATSFMRGAPCCMWGFPRSRRPSRNQPCWAGRDEESSPGRPELGGGGVACPRGELPRRPELSEGLTCPHGELPGETGARWGARVSPWRPSAASCCRSGRAGGPQLGVFRSPGFSHPRPQTSVWLHEGGGVAGSNWPQRACLFGLASLKQLDVQKNRVWCLWSLSQRS